MGLSIGRVGFGGREGPGGLGGRGWRGGALVKAINPLASLQCRDGFHRPGRHRVRQARSAVRPSAGESHKGWAAFYLAPFVRRGSTSCACFFAYWMTALNYFVSCCGRFQRQQWEYYVKEPRGCLNLCAIRYHPPCAELRFSTPRSMI